MATRPLAVRRPSALLAALLLVFVQLAAFDSAVRGCQASADVGPASRVVLVDAYATHEAPGAHPVDDAAAATCGTAACAVVPAAVTAAPASSGRRLAMPDDEVRSGHIAPPLIRPPIA